MERTLRSTVFLLCLLPFVAMLYGVLNNSLGPDPGEQLMHISGEWSIRFLALTLLVTPLRAWTGWQVLLRMRRMLGLYAFFYACLHLLVFLQLFVGWLPQALWEELVERPYITAGFAALVLMLPLALTSTRNMQRRLRRNWQRLHRLVYPAAILACVHLLWQSRSDVGEALVYIVFFGFLLGWRIWHRRARNPGAAAT
ncbi:MAG: sulfoxide reductase heme-binding subunit YedZ [Halioglobus sp.]|nr:sulfoxide reductase heme-binding subunit YedZ [Halioglobus sp.]